MDRKQRWLMVLAFVAGLVLACSAAAGDLAGRVRLVGELPATESLHPSADHAVCGREPRPPEGLVLSPSGGVKNAVAFIGHERMEGWGSPTIFQMDQRRCTFVPRVLIVPPGSTVEVLNSDGILHNFHTLSRVNPSVNLGQSGKAKPLRVTFEHPEIVQVKCDLHGPGFMRAWIVVARHPHYALTDDDGRFRLPDLPPGPHTLEIWHEILGSGEVNISVTFAGGGGGRRRASSPQ